MRLRRSWIRAIRVSAALAALYASGELAALKAAGFTGQVPVGGKVIKSLVGTLQSNWEWLIASGVEPRPGGRCWADDVRLSARPRPPIPGDRRRADDPGGHPGGPGVGGHGAPPET